MWWWIRPMPMKMGSRSALRLISRTIMWNVERHGRGFNYNQGNDAADILTICSVYPVIVETGEHPNDSVTWRGGSEGRPSNGDLDLGNDNPASPTPATDRGD